jgi:hypothetical protein
MWLLCDLAVHHCLHIHLELCIKPFIAHHQPASPELDLQGVSKQYGTRGMSVRDTSAQLRQLERHCQVYRWQAYIELTQSQAAHDNCQDP